VPHHAKANAPLQFSVLDGNLEVDLSPGYFEMRIKDLLVKRKQLTIQAIVFESPAGGSQPRSQGFSVRTRRDTRKPWSGPVTWRQKMAVVDSYSSRSGEIFFNEIYKSSKQINSQKTSQSILFMCRATKFGTNQLKSMKTPFMFSKIYRYFRRFSTTGKAASKLHLGVSMQVVIHTKFAFSRLEQYGYCYN
jgi:hypothetical protein